jgi:ADP-heptose:LPS heptosyltransferase
LKKRFPNSEIAYLAAPDPAQIAPFVPYVDRWVADGDKAGRLGLIQLARVLKSSNFDCSLELKPTPRTAAAAFLAKVEIRIGTARRAYSVLYNRRVDVHRRGSGKHQGDLDLELLGPLGIASSGILPRLELTSAVAAKAKILVGAGIGRYIVIHPGSGGSAPNWPLDYYRRLAVMIIQSAGRRVVVTGNNDPLGKFDERCLDLNGKTDMEGLAGVVAGADLFISGSTGPMHLADSLGTRCMPFFIRHSVIGPERWGPRRNMANVITPDQTCGCGSLNRCDCLRAITPEMAMEKLKSILGS